MKKMILALSAALMSAGLMAQSHDHIHIYGTGKTVDTYRGADLDSITFGGRGATGWETMLFSVNGKTVEHAFSKIDSMVFTTFAIPEIHVTLNDYPNWTELQGAKDAVRSAQLYMDGNGMYDDLKEETVEFRGRGNSTWNMPKKPYRFKMSKKKSVCGLPKAKTFALIANYIDNTLMRNAVALWMANYLEMPYSNHCVPVKVYLNGINKGQYMLTEKIGIGGGSVDIDETTGMLFELDSNYDETYRFYYNWESNGISVKIPVMVKDPDLDELAADAAVTNITNAREYFALWQEDFTKLCDAITSRANTRSLSDVLDVESAVNFFLVNGLAGNHELQHPKSTYIHKKSLESGEVYHFGPVWDFDWAFTYNGDETAQPDEPLLARDGDCAGYSFFRMLFNNQQFRTLYKQKLEAFKADGYPQLLAYMEEYANMIDPTAVENGNLWPARRPTSWYLTESSLDFRDNVEKLKQWIDKRLDYMLSHVNYGLYE